MARLRGCVATYALISRLGRYLERKKLWWGKMFQSYVNHTAAGVREERERRLHLHISSSESGKAVCRQPRPLSLTVPIKPIYGLISNCFELSYTPPYP